MASRLESRIKRLEAIQREGLDSLLDSLNFDQSQAFRIRLMGLLRDLEEPSDERVSQSRLSRVRYDAALASILQGMQERLMGAFMEKVNAAKGAA